MRFFAALRMTVLCSFLFVPACEVQPLKPPLVETVAILLFDNESNDINADTVMQSLTYLALKPTVYRVSDIRETNAQLEKMGITDGGQLPVLDPVKIAKELNVQALLYGSVENFSYTNIGYYQQRKVTLFLKMVDAATGVTLWENTQSGVTRNLTLDSKEAQKNFVKGLADQAADKLFNSPLEAEARQATIKTLFTLPGFYFNGFANDDASLTSVKRASKGVIKDIIQKR